MTDIEITVEYNDAGIRVALGGHLITADSIRELSHWNNGGGETINDWDGWCSLARQLPNSKIIVLDLSNLYDIDPVEGWQALCRLNYAVEQCCSRPIIRLANLRPAVTDVLRVGARLQTFYFSPGTLRTPFGLTPHD